LTALSALDEQDALMLVSRLKRRGVSGIFRPLHIVVAAATLIWSSVYADDLPPGLTRLNPAGLPQAWLLEDIPFSAYSAPVPGIETQPVHRLRHLRKGYFYAVTNAEAVAAESAGFVHEAIAFHVPVRRGIKIHRLRAPASGEYLYSPNPEEGVRAGYVDEGVAFRAETSPDASKVLPTTPVVGVACYRNTRSGIRILTAGRESPYVVGAFYFDAYGPAAANTIAGALRVYGRKDDWWAGVRDFYGAEPGLPRNTRGWGGDWSYLKPSIGYYDVRSKATLEAHIRQAADAGLSFFSFYWWWSSNKNDERTGDAVVSFLGARNSALLKFNLALYAHPWDEDMAVMPNQMPDVARRLVGYFRQPNYLRLPNGRPVLAIGDFRNFRGSDGKKCGNVECMIAAVQNFVLILKRTAGEVGEREPYVQIQAGAPGWDRVPSVDGVSCITPPVRLPAGATPYPRLTSDIFNTLRKTGKPVSPCMFENFDERPRQDVLITDRARIRYLEGKSDEIFRQNLLATKQFSDDMWGQGHHPAARIIYLYAWNEWHEGGILEPNVATGARDLNIVSDAFDLPRSRSPCLDQGECHLP
jgi:hypothetical protein